MRVLLMGGYGAVGFETARLLVDNTEAEVVIAGRNVVKAQAAAIALSEGEGRGRVSSTAIDASNHDDVVSAFRLVDWVVICVPVTGIGANLAKAALEAGVHYVDINANREKQRFLHAKAAEIEERGLTFVTEAGLGPGLPSLLVRYAHDELGRLQRAELASFFRESKVTRGSAKDMLVALGDEPRVLEAGRWRKAGMRDARTIDFGPSFGRHRCYPVEFYELATLPIGRIGVTELGFYAAGFNRVIDLMVTVWMVTGLYKLTWGLRLGVRIAMWAARFTRPPVFTLIQADVTAQDGQEMRVTVGHENAYFGTAVPLAACMIRLLETDPPSRAGLHLMGHLLEPGGFLKDLKEMGMEVHTSGLRRPTPSLTPPGLGDMP